MAQEAFAVIGESVWWITVLDTSLESTPAYKKLLDESPSVRDTLRGVRSVRNRIGHEASIVDFVDLDYVFEIGDGAKYHVWTWKEVPSPKRAHDQDHQAYVSALQGEPVDETFRWAALFLGGVADATYPPDTRVPSLDVSFKRPKRPS
jgi:hypothetical protein